MNEIAYWAEVSSFSYAYDPEDDVIVIYPLDENGEAINEELDFAVDADKFSDLIGKLAYDAKEVLDIRRQVRKAKKKGLNVEAVQARHNGMALADELDHFFRKNSA